MEKAFYSKCTKHLFNHELSMKENIVSADKFPKKTVTYAFFFREESVCLAARLTIKTKYTTFLRLFR